VFERITQRLTYANVMSTLALFAALGTGSAWAAGQIGTAGIKDGAVTTAKLHAKAVTQAKVAPNALTGANIVESSLAQVPSAKTADTATSANHAASADTAASATHATTADSATNATHAAAADTATPTGTAGGALAGAYPNPQLAAPEAVHALTLAASWISYSATSTPGYWKDPFGVVHLQGMASNGTAGSTIATLPAGYRPPAPLFFGALTSNGGTTLTPGEVDVLADGSVVFLVGNNGMVSLNGIEFRAG
jgi:hypothetical protein